MKLFRSFHNLLDTPIFSPAPIFSHLSRQLLFPCTRSQQCFTTATIRSFDLFEEVELPLSAYCLVALLLANSKLAENFQPSNEVLAAVMITKKLSTSIRSELASHFYHDKKSTFRLYNPKDSNLLYTDWDTERILWFDWLRGSPYMVVRTGVWTGQLTNTINNDLPFNLN